MKIYIENYNPKKITAFVLYKKLDEYFRKRTSEYEIYSTNGIYTLQNNKIYKITLENTSKTPQKILNYFCDNVNKNIIIDYSNAKQELHYQLPISHVCNKTETFVYSRSEKSLVELVVKGFYIKKEIELNNKDTNYFISDNKYLNLNVSDFYFNIKKDMELSDMNLREDLEFFYRLIE